MFAPHNDYVRRYYDGGLIGVFLWVNLTVSNLRRLMRSRTAQNDYAILMYLSIFAYCFTENYEYFLFPLLGYVFIACSIPQPLAGESPAAEPLAACGAVAAPFRFTRTPMKVLQINNWFADPAALNRWSTT